MDTESLAPVVGSILDAADTRGGDRPRLSVSPRSFPAAVATATADGRVPVIAEIKPTSPTTDGTRRDDPVELAEQMVAGGATALSVLTEPTHFGGSPDALERVREAVEVPVLRKDFILHERQLDTVAADMVLLIARFLDDLDEMVTAARQRGFQVLVETHTASEVEAAVEAGADIVGVNNRDLTQLEVDLETFERVAPTVPDDVVLVAESGIETRAAVERMRAAGADALLVGSAIMDGDVSANTRRLTTERDNS
ncbi:indole-3-glycerol phosphate synthase [Halovenus aranensis]|uniref:Indole-3-glycerol phosphate synthase n=1 Tax=Halovenus aranensis TaxID=890420 RepID=A0A1G8W7E9_9EURY|nr:indole-3-glycerol phosphate synthase [Halovenus aranensis]SDJ73430.1 indole-3-glycerol phosphate synthase [Halovenus aranensis]